MQLLSRACGQAAAGATGALRHLAPDGLHTATTCCCPHAGSCACAVLNPPADLCCSINISLGPSEDRLLITGLHTVADIYCTCCNTVLGWKYVSNLLPPAGQW